MKKVIFMALMAATVFASACSEEQKDAITPPMTGFWQCTKISTLVGEVETPLNSDSKYLSLFSIGYMGIANAGIYMRVGAGDLSVNGLSNALPQDSTDASLWSKFFTHGTFTYDAQTITHTASGGDTEQFAYMLSDDGKTLTLASRKGDLTGGGTTANTVKNVLSVLFGKTIDTDVIVLYEYTKTDMSTLLSKLSDLAKEEEK